MTKLFSPKEDLVFKLLFGDERHIELLEYFLKAVLPLLDDDLAGISLIPPTLTTESPDDKLGILDVHACTRSGRLLDVEIQLASSATLPRRILFYAARMITGQLGEGDPYEEIKPVVLILITGFKLLGSKRSPHYHHCYRLYDPVTRTEFTDYLEVNTLELPKLPRAPDGTKLWDWLRFMETQDEEELDMLAEKNPEVCKAVRRLKELSADEEARALFEASDKARRDQLSREFSARVEGERRGLEKGRKEGLEKGRKEERLALARNLLKMGFQIERIVEATGLSVDEIQSLRAQ